MRYLCLGYHNEQIWAQLPAAEREALTEASLAYERELREQGYVIAGIALQAPHTASTLRFGEGQTLITDGPFAETKEQLGGALLIEAKDLNHAIQLMEKTPCMRAGGSLEIRPLNEALTTAAGLERRHTAGCLDSAA